MDPEAPTRGHRRGIRRWFWLLLAALPVAALLLANLWLASPPARRWIAGKIQRQVGLETRIGGASVWPWNGVRLSDVEVLQPTALRAAVKEPFVHIAAIRLNPVWRTSLRGKLLVRSVELDSPRLVLPVELLADLAAKSQAAPPPAPPVVAAAPPMVGPPAPVPGPPAPTPEPAPAPPQAAAVTPPPTAWLHLKNASITILSASTGKPWLDVSGVSGSIPIAGGRAASSLHLTSVNFVGENLFTDLEASLDWQHPLLSLKPLETEIHGIKLQLAAKLGMLSGVPLQMEALVPRQVLARTQLPANGHAQAEAIAANARFRGLLLSPGTWQGELVMEALSPAGSIAGHDAKFERGSAVTVLRGGTLSCVDARLIGDDLSLLGNATLLADGRLAAALRIVAPPETAGAVAKRMFPDIAKPLPLTPLSTPQRAAFDLEALGNIRQLSLRLGMDGPVVELKR